MHPELFEGATEIIRQGYAYWQQQSGDRPAPTWREINPADIVKLLPNIVVLHVLWEPLDFVERINGQNIVDNLFRNSMHIRWRSFPERGPGSDIWNIMCDVVNRKQPSFQQVPYVGPQKEFLSIQSVICQISDDGITINKTVAFVDFIEKPSLWGHIPT